MNIRKTLPADLPAIGKLYEAARAALGAMGVDQWQTGDYPSAQDAEDMMADQDKEKKGEKENESV